MQKLTLSVDGSVVLQAKRYAAARGTSLSGLVEMMLRMVAGGKTEGTSSVRPPVLSRLTGSLRKGSESDYRAYLQKKHR